MSKSNSASKAWLRRQTRTGRRQARPVVMLGLLSGAFAIGQAWCVALLLATALRRAGDPAHAPIPWTALACFVALAVLRSLVQFAAENAATNAGAAARRRVRGEALQVVLAQGPALLRRGHSGALAALVVDRIEALDGLFARWLPAGTLAMAVPLMVLAAAFVAQPAAGLVLLATGFCVPVAQAAFGIGAAAASRRQFTAMARLQARFLDRMRGIATIVLAGRAEAEAEALGQAAAELRVRTMRVLRVAFLSSVALDVALAVALVIIAIRDGHLLLRHDTPLPLATRSLFALLLVPEFFAPLRSFALAYQDRMHAVAAAEDLTALPEAPAEAAHDATQAAPPAIRNVAAHGVTVAFDHVTYRWDSTRPPALRDLSFRVPAGETVVLAGPSGAGKSTVIELLLGFIAPQGGQITINGAPLGSIVPQALSRMTSWIGQKPVLFAGSLRENILFARPGATEAELDAALRDAQLDEVVALLPQGLDTPIGEGGFGLSGGQAQRVAIARAFLKNAPLLLLDEPTGHLDPATELRILDSLRRLSLNRTVILVSHSAAAHAFGGRRIDLPYPDAAARGAA